MNILIFAGTSNGRKLATTLVGRGYGVTVSSMSAHGNSLIPDDLGIIRRYGKMARDDISTYIAEQDIHVVIDATHPYAVDISRHIIAVTELIGVPMIRYERTCSIEPDRGKHYQSYEEVCEYLSAKEGNVFFTTGVNYLDRIVTLMGRDRLVVRILPVDTSLEKARRCGLEEYQIIAEHPPYSLEDNIALIRKHQVEYLVTKDSGLEGGTEMKLQAVRETGVELIVIDRPRVDYEVCCYGEEEIIGWIEGKE